MTAKKKRAPIVILMLIGILGQGFQVYDMVFSDGHPFSSSPVWVKSGLVAAMVVQLFAGLLILLWRRAGFYLLPIAATFGAVFNGNPEKTLFVLLLLSSTLALYYWLWINRIKYLGWDAYS